MKTEPTSEQSRKALAILLKASSEGFKAILITKEQREDLMKQDFDKLEKQWWLMPAFIIDSRYWCGWDTYFGHDVVIDLQNKKSHTSKQGIFEPEFVFISDYHGFSDGAFYYRSE